MKITKAGISILLASAMCASAMPSAFAGAGGCAVGGTLGVIAGSFVGGDARTAAQISGGLLGCGVGHKVQDKGNSRSNRNGDVNLGPVGSQRNAELNRNQGKAKPPVKIKPAIQQPAIAAAPAKPKIVADPQVLEVQTNLAKLGYDQVGKPDGFAGKGTTAAVKAFQKDQGLPETGVLDATLIATIAMNVKSTVDLKDSQTASTVVGTEPAQSPAATSPNSVAAVDQDEMTLEEYQEAAREEGAITEGETVQVEEPAKVAVEQPVEVVLVPKSEKPVQKTAPAASKLTSEW